MKVETRAEWGVMVAADVRGVRGTHRLHANTAEPTQGRDIPRRAQRQYAIVLKVSNPPVATTQCASITPKDPMLKHQMHTLAF